MNFFQTLSLFQIMALSILKEANNKTTAWILLVNQLVMNNNKNKLVFMMSKFNFYLNTAISRDLEMMTNAQYV